LYSFTNGQDIPAILEDEEISIARFLVYIIYSVWMGCFVGYILRKGIEKVGLDIKYSRLASSSPWHYILRGKGMNITNKNKPLIYTQIDALIDTGQGSFIYTGVLEKYFLNTDGYIDKIVLKRVRRRNLNEDFLDQGNQPAQNPGQDPQGASDSKYYWMPGTYFVIYGKTIRNINITFYQLELDDENNQMSISIIGNSSNPVAV
jgi:hypothetical protein